MPSKNNNLSNKLNNSMNVVNNNVKKVVQNELLINVIRVLLIIYASFVVPSLNENQLKVVNNSVVRLVVIALIVYLSFMDVVTAVLLTICVVITLHHAGKVAQKKK